MSATRPSIFGQKALATTSAPSLRNGTDVGSLVGEARRAGGIIASWRLSKQVNNEIVQSVGEAIAAHFAARREEMGFRIVLMLDNAKKQLIADSLVDTAAIEREIVRMTQDVIKDLLEGRLDASRQAAL